MQIRKFMFLSVALLSLLPFAPAIAKDSFTTPPKGSVLRKQLMNALREHGQDHDRIFVIKHLRVAGKWAFTIVEPQSTDGNNHYETESALLKRAAKNWQVVDQPCAEDGCDYEAEIERLKNQYAAPDVIFPQ
jgi:hypothetical protein